MRQFNDSRLLCMRVLRAVREEYGSSTSRWNRGHLCFMGCLCVVLWVSIWFLYNTFIIWVHIVQRRTLLVPVLGCSAARVHRVRAAHTDVWRNWHWPRMKRNERHERASRCMKATQYAVTEFVLSHARIRRSTHKSRTHRLPTSIHTIAHQQRRIDSIDDDDGVVIWTVIYVLVISHRSGGAAVIHTIVYRLAHKLRSTSEPIYKCPRRLFHISPYSILYIISPWAPCNNIQMFSFCICCTLPVNTGGACACAPCANNTIGAQTIATAAALLLLCRSPTDCSRSVYLLRTGKKLKKRKTTNWFIAMVYCVLSRRRRLPCACIYLNIAFFENLLHFVCAAFTLAASLCVHSALPHTQAVEHPFFSLNSCCFAAFMMCRSSFVWAAHLVCSGSFRSFRVRHFGKKYIISSYFTFG